MTEEELMQYKKESSKHFEMRWWYEPIGCVVCAFIIDTILKLLTKLLFCFKYKFNLSILHLIYYLQLY